MILMDSRHTEKGQKIPMEKGKSQLKSETAEVFFKDIEIRKLDYFPKEYANY